MNAFDRPRPRRFDAEQARLCAAVAALGGGAELALDQALAALAREDAVALELARARARALDPAAAALEGRVTQLLALRQPVAGDLRALLCAIKVIAALRRAAGITAGLTPAGAAAGARMTTALDRLGRSVRAQLSDALTAWQQEDVAAARAVRRREDGIDGHYDAILAAARAEMQASPAAVDAGARWMLTAKALERIGDLAAEIAGAALRQAQAPLDPAPSRDAGAGAQAEGARRDGIPRDDASCDTPCDHARRDEAWPADGDAARSRAAADPGAARTGAPAARRRALP
ncbi:phosphate signaling complex PhoU family protein [Rhodovulum sp. DZ06]|uniref:phosphate signaling complex PhoU family protein n=1 Tax=Rhodovulum sp. DZ06 TaxID=3425126 RepID=UPI003D33117F